MNAETNEVNPLDTKIEERLSSLIEGQRRSGTQRWERSFVAEQMRKAAATLETDAQREAFANAIDSVEVFTNSDALNLHRDNIRAGILYFAKHSSYELKNVAAHALNEFVKNNEPRGGGLGEMFKFYSLVDYIFQNGGHAEYAKLIDDAVFSNQSAGLTAQVNHWLDPEGSDIGFQVRVDGAHSYLEEIARLARLVCHAPSHYEGAITRLAIYRVMLTAGYNLLNTDEMRQKWADLGRLNTLNVLLDVTLKLLTKSDSEDPVTPLEMGSAFLNSEAEEATNEARRLLNSSRRG